MLTIRKKTARGNNKLKLLAKNKMFLRTFFCAFTQIIVPLQQKKDEIILP